MSSQQNPTVVVLYGGLTDYTCGERQKMCAGLTLSLREATQKQAQI